MDFIYLITGLLIGTIAMLVMMRSWRVRIADSESKLTQTLAELEKLRSDNMNLFKENANLNAQNTANIQKYESLLNEREVVQQQMRNEFALMANGILEDKSKRFTELNAVNLDRLLNPLNQKLTEFKLKVEETYDKESKQRFSLEEKIKELVVLNKRISDEANSLTKALKGDTKSQGDWGEMILESILDKSGLVKGREYFTQETMADETGKKIISDEGRKMRPDVIIAYPDQRKVIIDSKVSLTAYSRYVDADTDEERKTALLQHIRSVKSHVDELSAKRYQDYTDSLDFVMMFVPNEPAFMLVMQQDAQLWQYAYDKRVLLISPTNLIAALKLIADLWKREYQNRNALEIAERGAALYDKFVGFVESMNDVGSNLDKTVLSYRTALNQLKDGRGNLCSQAEKLRQLGVKAKKQMPLSFQNENSEIESE